LFIFSCFAFVVSAQTPTSWQSPENLAAALLAAKSPTERAALLQSQKEFVTIELRQALLAQGDKASNQRNWQQALDAYEIARTVAAQINDQEGLGTCAFKTGNVYFSQNRYRQALDFFQQSLTIRRALPDQAALVDSLRVVGSVQRLLGNIGEALDALHSAESLLPEITENRLKAGIFNVLGLTYRTMGDNTQALFYTQQALRLYELIADKRAVAGTQSNLGNIYQSQGDFDLALEYARKSLATSTAIEDKSLMAISQNSLGNVYFAKGDYRSAMEFYQKSLKLKEEINDTPGITNTLSNLGRIYYRQGDYDKALDYFNRSIESKKLLNDKAGIAGVLTNIALIYREQNDLTKAADYFQQSLQLAKETRSNEVLSEALNNLGTIYFEQGNREKALATFNEGLALREKNQNKRGVSGSLENLAMYHILQNNPAAALTAAEQSYAIAKDSGELEAIWHALSLQGQAYKMLGKTLQARQAFLQAVDAIESLRAQAAGDVINQQYFLAKKISPFHQLTELYLQEGKNEQALFYAERSKARLLLGILQSGKVNITKAMSAADKEQERILRDENAALNNQLERENARANPDPTRLADLQERLKKASLNQQAFQEKLYATHPELKVQRGQTANFNLREAARLLPDTQTALLEYATTSDRTFLFVLTKNLYQPVPRLRVYELAVPPFVLDSLTQNFRELLATHNLLFRAASAQLYEWLIKPAQADLQGKTKLVIIPDGKLWELPFQALQSDDSRYLIEHFAISYAPSLSVLSEMVRQRDKKPNHPKSLNLLAFANPTLHQGAENFAASDGQNAQENFSALPESEVEVKRLAALYGSHRSNIYLGRAASEERLKAEAPSFRILHIATHGVLNNASPMYSQIVLSQATAQSKEDGLLEAWEIAQLDLAADLVVLSACETARGRLSNGEGVIGLTWAFFVAGSSATLVSQWKVDEASTADLMFEFHHHLQSSARNSPKALSKAEALRKATLKILQSKQYRHPFYWAAFVIIGDSW
jgi:CHAT domain-containing protein/Flp pilus assembly protein TadD